MKHADILGARTYWLFKIIISGNGHLTTEENDGEFKTKYSYKVSIYNLVVVTHNIFSLTSQLHLAG